jgi:hypothetical protein
VALVTRRAEVARDAERLAAILLDRRVRPEEVDDLQALGRGAPRAEAKPGRDRAVAMGARAQCRLDEL